VIASYGFSRQIIYKWLREARGKGRGLRTLERFPKRLNRGFP
jgi:hypothetical protein